MMLGARIVSLAVAYGLAGAACVRLWQRSVHDRFVAWSVTALCVVAVASLLDFYGIEVAERWLKGVGWVSNKRFLNRLAGEGVLAEYRRRRKDAGLPPTAWWIAGGARAFVIATGVAVFAFAVWTDLSRR